MTSTGVPALAGPALSPARGPARHLVVMVHGYGADGKDLIGLADHWRPLLPDAAFAAPNAPQRVPGAPGYQWFPISRIDPHEMHKGVQAAAPMLDAFLDAELERLGLAGDRLALVGFSQGTMMSLHVGLRRAAAPAAIVGYSGMLVLPEVESEIAQFQQEIRSRPPVLLVHGDSDDLIPVQALFHAAQGLSAMEVPVEFHVSAGIGHGIDQEGLRHGGEFLARRFGKAR